MVSIGCGSADLNALAAHLDVPLAPRFAETYRKCEEFIGKAMIAVADESQNEACAVSAQMARERADEFASRAVPLPIGTTVNFEGRELTNIGASFDGACNSALLAMALTAPKADTRLWFARFRRRSSTAR